MVCRVVSFDVFVFTILPSLNIGHAGGKIVLIRHDYVGGHTSRLGGVCPAFMRLAMKSPATLKTRIVYFNIAESAIKLLDLLKHKPAKTALGARAPSTGLSED